MYERLTVPVPPMFVALTIAHPLCLYLEYDVVYECIGAERFCTALLSTKRSVGGKNAFLKQCLICFSWCIIIKSTFCTFQRYKPSRCHYSNCLHWLCFILLYSRVEKSEFAGGSWNSLYTCSPRPHHPLHPTPSLRLSPISEFQRLGKGR